MTTFEKVLHLAKENNRSLASISTEAGLSRDTVLKWKTSIPNVNNLASVAKVLDVKIDELLAD